MFNVSCENQHRADERIPILPELPFKHKGIMCAPFIGPVSELLTVKEAAEQLKIRRVQIRKIIRNGELAAVKVGREYRIPLVCLKEHVEANLT